MSKDDFHVTDQQLADILGISLVKLYEVVDFFDNDPNDQWSLNEGEHFVWHIHTIKSRRFSEIGALLLAKYLDSIEKKIFLAEAEGVDSTEEVQDHEGAGSDPHHGGC